MTPTPTPPAAGSAGARCETHTAEYPFVRSVYDVFDADGSHDVPCWAPGVRHVWCGPEDTEAVADGIGFVTYTVVSEHRPGPGWPTRVFYTRQWIDPSGKRFGKNKLHIATKQKFRRLCRGYSHEYRIAGPNDEPADRQRNGSSLKQSQALFRETLAAHQPHPGAPA